MKSCRHVHMHTHTIHTIKCVTVQRDNRKWDSLVSTSQSSRKDAERLTRMYDMYNEMRDDGMLTNKHNRLLRRQLTDNSGRRFCLTKSRQFQRQCFEILQVSYVNNQTYNQHYTMKSFISTFVMTLKNIAQTLCIQTECICAMCT